MSVAARALMLAFAFCVASCNDYDRGVADCRVIARRYLHGSIAELSERFPSYAPELQFQIYICAKQYTTPPRIGMAYLFDASAVPYLGQQLGETHSDMTVRDIVEVFAVLSVSAQYDFRANPELLNLMDRRVRAMRSPFWRSYTMERVREVRTGKIHSTPPLVADDQAM